MRLELQVKSISVSTHPERKGNGELDCSTPLTLQVEKISAPGGTVTCPKPRSTHQRQSWN